MVWWAFLYGIPRRVMVSMLIKTVPTRLWGVVSCGLVQIGVRLLTMAPVTTESTSAMVHILIGIPDFLDNLSPKLQNLCRGDEAGKIEKLKRR